MIQFTHNKLYVKGTHSQYITRHIIYIYIRSNFSPVGRCQ